MFAGEEARESPAQIFPGSCTVWHARCYTDAGMGPLDTADRSHAGRSHWLRALVCLVVSGLGLAGGLPGCSLGSGIDLPSAGNADEDGDGGLNSGDGDSNMPPTEGVDQDDEATGGAGGGAPYSMGGGSECGLGGELPPTVMGATTCLH